MSDALKLRRVLAGFAVSGMSLVLMGGVAAAQNTTGTTQLDTSGGSTATTQLDVGGGTATTVAPPTQVAAGGGGTAGGPGVPFAAIALAGAGVVVVGGTAERFRRQTAR